MSVIDAIIAKKLCGGGGSTWTSAQIALLNQLFDCIPWTNAGAGAIADSLIASLSSTSSPEDSITQSGGILTIIALKTAPNQTGNVLTVA